MGSRSYVWSILVAVALTTFALPARVHASDPELTTDFAVPAGVNASTLDGSFFTFTGFQNLAAINGKLTITKAFVGEFPALDGLGVSYAFLIYPVGTLNVPHTHPRGTELLYVLQGTLSVGLVDTTNKLFTSTLYAGDVFVFPKGLVHFQINLHKTQEARAIAAFSSSNPGTVSLPTTLFGSGISNTVLEKAFEVSSSVIEELEAPFAS